MPGRGTFRRLAGTDAGPHQGVVSAGPVGRPQPAGGDVLVVYAMGRTCGSRPSAQAWVTYMLTVSTW